MKRTIRLESGMYRLNGFKIVEFFYATPTGYYPNYDAADFQAELDKSETWGWHPTRYQVGAQAVLVSSTDVSTNAIRSGKNVPHFSLSFDLDGVPGNSNPKIKSTIGWRGTTDDLSVDAHGIVTIRKIHVLKNGDIAVTVS